MEAVCDYFAWLQGSPPPAAPPATPPLPRLLAFLDRLSVFYAAVGVPRGLAGAALKVAKGFSPDERATAAQQVDWQSPSLKGSTMLWRSLKAALRNALETPIAEAQPDDGGTRSARKRVKRSFADE